MVRFSVRHINIFFLAAGLLLGVAGVSSAGERGLFPSMKQRMGYLSERQAVLSRNIANANTPGYKAKDLASPDRSSQGKLRMRTTNSRHIALGNSGSGRFKTIENDTFETTPSGNSVVLDEEMVKVSQNNMDYQETTNLYKKWGGLLKTAINGGR